MEKSLKFLENVKKILIFRKMNKIVILLNNYIKIFNENNYNEFYKIELPNENIIDIYKNSKRRKLIIFKENSKNKQIVFYNLLFDTFTDKIIDIKNDEVVNFKIYKEDKLFVYTSECNYIYILIKKKKKILVKDFIDNNYIEEKVNSYYKLNIINDIKHKIIEKLKMNFEFKIISIKYIKDSYLILLTDIDVVVLISSDFSYISHILYIKYISKIKTVDDKNLIYFVSKDKKIKLYDIKEKEITKKYKYSFSKILNFYCNKKLNLMIIFNISSVLYLVNLEKNILLFKIDLKLNNPISFNFNLNRGVYILDNDNNLNFYNFNKLFKIKRKLLKQKNINIIKVFNHTDISYSIKNTIYYKNEQYLIDDDIFTILNYLIIDNYIYILSSDIIIIFNIKTQIVEKKLEIKNLFTNFINKNSNNFLIVLLKNNTIMVIETVNFKILKIIEFSYLINKFKSAKMIDDNLFIFGYNNKIIKFNVNEYIFNNYELKEYYNINDLTIIDKDSFCFCYNNEIAVIKKDIFYTIRKNISDVINCLYFYNHLLYCGTDDGYLICIDHEIKNILFKIYIKKSFTTFILLDGFLTSLNVNKLFQWYTHYTENFIIENLKNNFHFKTYINFINFIQENVSFNNELLFIKYNPFAIINYIKDFNIFKNILEVLNIPNTSKYLNCQILSFISNFKSNLRIKFVLKNNIKNRIFNRVLVNNLIGVKYMINNLFVENKLGSKNGIITFCKLNKNYIDLLNFKILFQIYYYNLYTREYKFIVFYYIKIYEKKMIIFNIFQSIVYTVVIINKSIKNQILNYILILFLLVLFIMRSISIAKIKFYFLFDNIIYVIISVFNIIIAINSSLNVLLVDYILNYLMIIEIFYILRYIKNIDYIYYNFKINWFKYIYYLVPLVPIYIMLLYVQNLNNLNNLLTLDYVQSNQTVNFNFLVLILPIINFIKKRKNKNWIFKEKIKELLILSQIFIYKPKSDDINYLKF